MYQLRKNFTRILFVSEDEQQNSNNDKSIDSFITTRNTFKYFSIRYIYIYKWVVYKIHISNNNNTKEYILLKIY